MPAAVLPETGPIPGEAARPEPGAIPPGALHYGFIIRPTGTHLNKTLMLAEVSLLFGASRAETARSELRRLAVEDNVLLKSTVTNRIDTFKRLSALYGLDPGIPLYRVLRDCWTVQEREQPLLALLLACARDPMLRCTAPWLLALEPGAPVSHPDFSDLVAAVFPDRYSTASLRTAGQNLAASWKQSGHLSGKLRKVRSRTVSGPVSAALALFMAHLCGERGQGLFDSLWAELLDVRPDLRHQLAFQASQRGLLEYRHGGSVIDLSFSRFQRLLETTPAGEEAGHA